jgi:hypothetical protein
MNPKAGGMSQTKVKKLTPQQAALIPVYLQKWRASSLSTGPINPSQAEETVKSAYSAIGLKAPEIIFVDRPSEAADLVLSRLDNPSSQLRSSIREKTSQPARKTTARLFGEPTRNRTAKPTANLTVSSTLYSTANANVGGAPQLFSWLHSKPIATGRGVQ